jgi:hypothetical protein
MTREIYTNPLPILDRRGARGAKSDQYKYLNIHRLVRVSSCFDG